MLEFFKKCKPWFIWVVVGYILFWPARQLFLDASSQNEFLLEQQRIGYEYLDKPVHTEGEFNSFMIGSIIFSLLLYGPLTLLALWSGNITYKLGVARGWNIYASWLSGFIFSIFGLAVFWIISRTAKPIVHTQDLKQVL